MRADQQEELRAAAAATDPMATEWLTDQSTYPMFHALDGLGYRISPRKLRLFGLACCAQLPDLKTDPDCARIIALAEEMLEGTASANELAQVRAELKHRFLKVCDGTPNLWAAKGLLQDDDDYQNKAPIQAGDPDLRRVCESVSSIISESPYEQYELLREVLGNPFVPVTFDPDWRTDPVMILARSIYHEQDFGRLTSLAKVLESAGCDDQRILKHLRRKGGHVSGCWALDLILDLEQKREEEEFTWSFTWEHPTIPQEKLQRRLQAFGTDAPGDAHQVDDTAALDFAAWLKRNGDPAWGRYVRVRCAMDGRPPGAGFPDLVEECYESAAAMRPGRAEFKNFYFSGYQFAEQEWWESRTDDMERGLPSLVDAVIPGEGPGPVGRLIESLDALVRQTPVRGINFQSHYEKEMSQILSSPGAQPLRWIVFENSPEKGKTGPVIDALVNSPLVPRLERLEISNGLRSDADALALADAPFKRLCRLDLSAFDGVSCSPKAVARLMRAPWMAELGQWRTGFTEECCETGMANLARLVKLHTLTLWNPTDRQVLAMDRIGELPSLRRLMINHCNLTGKCQESFRQMKLPKLIELWIDSHKVTADDIRALSSASFFRNLRLLTFASAGLDEAGLEALASTPCARKLRTLRLLCGGSDCVGRFRSLAHSPMTRPGVFPSLTTLQIEHPYAKSVKKKDMAGFLATLGAPALRHLILDDCDIDDGCADALATNPAFAGLTRLRLKQSYDATGLLSLEAARRMMRSPNLKNLVELEIENFAAGSALKTIANKKTLPKVERVRIR